MIGRASNVSWCVWFTSSFPLQFPVILCLFVFFFFCFVLLWCPLWLHRHRWGVWIPKSRAERPKEINVREILCGFLPYTDAPENCCIYEFFLLLYACVGLEGLVWIRAIECFVYWNETQMHRGIHIFYLFYSLILVGVITIHYHCLALLGFFFSVFSVFRFDYLSSNVFSSHPLPIFLRIIM